MYEDVRHPWALTGVRDENGQVHSNYAYDEAGRAVSTELAGGVARYAASYSTAPSWNVTETYESSRLVVWRDHSWNPPADTVVELPNGQQSALLTELNNGMPRLSVQSQPAGSGCAASSSTMTYDSNGNVASSNDFNGNRTCSAYDLSRNLRTTHVEGLDVAQDCNAVTPIGAALPAGSRKTSTEWHALWPLRKRVVEPGKLTTFVYNGQTDPFVGGTASCAPVAAKLPDQSPIAVLCKQVEQATDDATGAQGFAAPLSAGVAARVHQWTYNVSGQVLTHDGALTGSADLTTFSYYTDTAYAGSDPNAEGHTIGDLATTTNAVGKITNYVKYNKIGQLLQSSDPNGVATQYQYNGRHQLMSRAVGTEAISYSYYPTGLLKRVTQPDGVAYIEYEYDDAHRLRFVRDNLGNSVEYTLDLLGNRTGETYKDSGGALRRTLTRGIDALGRVQEVTGRE